MSYGIKLDEAFRRAAVFVDKILKGTKPADIPVEQPTKFEFAINCQNSESAQPDHSAVGAVPGG